MILQDRLKEKISSLEKFINETNKDPSESPVPFIDGYSWSHGGIL